MSLWDTNYVRRLICDVFPLSSTNDERQTEIWDWSCIQNDQRHQERWRCSGADLDKARPGIQVILLRQSGHHLRVFRIPRPVRHQPSRQVRHPMHYAIPLRSLRHSQAQALRRSRTGKERTKFRVISSSKFSFSAKSNVYWLTQLCSPGFFHITPLLG